MIILEALVVIILLYFVIGVCWQIAELELYGKVTPRLTDDVVTVILAISLYFNFS
jgi:uncharacterized membrane protein YjfL (UPF0719 family)